MAPTEEQIEEVLYGLSLATQDMITAQCVRRAQEETDYDAQNPAYASAYWRTMAELVKEERPESCDW